MNYFTVDGKPSYFIIENFLNRETLRLSRMETMKVKKYFGGPFEIERNETYPLFYFCSFPFKNKKEYEKELDRLQKKYQSDYDEILKKNKI